MESADSNLSAVMAHVGNKVNCGKNKPREDRSVSCPVCDEAFKFGFSTSKIWSHLSKSHRIEKYNLLCYVCAQIFPQLRLLNVHLKIVHANGASHKCLICGKMTTSVVDLKAHMVKRHQNYKRRYVDCRLCRRYIRNENFRKHLQKHVENIQDEIQPSPSQRMTKGRSELMINPIYKSELEEIPKALDASSTQPVVKVEMGQIENPIIPALNKCSGVNSFINSPVFGIGNYEQSEQKSSCYQASLDGADTSHRSQSRTITVMPGSTVWEYSLAVSDSVSVKSPDGNRVWSEWILNVPDVPPCNN